MDEIILSYTDFKTRALAKNLSVQFTSTATVYHLFAADGPFKITARIHRPSETSDATDFETNLQPTANAAVTSAVSGSLALSGALPAGTNAIGKLASNTGVTIGAVEVAASQTLSTVTTVGTVSAIATTTDKTTSGSLTALNDAATLSTNGVSTVGIQITGTWVGTVVFEATLDGSTWFSKNAFPHSGTGAVATSTTGNTQLLVNTAGCTQFRVRRSVATSGTAVVNVAGSSAPGITIATTGNINNHLVAAGQTGTWTVQPGNTPNTTAWLVSAPPVDGTKTTYSVSSAILCEAAPTEVLLFIGSATKTVRITRINLTGYMTATLQAPISEQIVFYLYKWSAVPTGGTSASQTLIPLDSANAAATAAVKTYTANPTGGTSLGKIRSQTMLFPAFADTAASQVPIDWRFGERGQALVLRGTAEAVSLNLGGNANMAGAFIFYYIEWTEE